jgi:cation-transporting ATPase E
VLLDGRFDRLPMVVAEGRRVITNMERVSALFVTKTVYAALFAFTIGVWGAAFPFLPRHMSLVSEVTIGIPAFALSFRSTDRPYRPGYIRRVLRFAVPAGVVTAVVTLGAYWIMRAFDVELDEARTGSTIVLIVLALWVLALLMQPIDRFDGAVLAAMVVLLLLATLTPLGRSFYELHWPDGEVVAVLAGYVAVVVGTASIVVRRVAVGELVERVARRVAHRAG